MTELSEAQIQNKVIREAKNIPYKGKTIADYIVHVANGGKRSKRVGAALKHNGVKRGYPDLVIDIARGGFHGLRIEIKKPDDGTVSKEQVERLQMLKDEGYRAVVTEGYQETMDEILNYLGLWP